MFIKTVPTGLCARESPNEQEVQLAGCVREASGTEHAVVRIIGGDDLLDTDHHVCYEGVQSGCCLWLLTGSQADSVTDWDGEQQEVQEGLTYTGHVACLGTFKLQTAEHV